MFGGRQDAFYRFENIAGLGQDRDWIEGSGHGPAVQRVPDRQLTQQFFFDAYLLSPGRGNGIRVRPLFFVTVN